MLVAVAGGVGLSYFVLGWLSNLLLCKHRCLVALYFIGADKDKLQTAMTEKGAVGPVVRLCRSSQSEIQAEAADVAKVLARNATACSIIAECGRFLVGKIILDELAEYSVQSSLPSCQT